MCSVCLVIPEFLADCCVVRVVDALQVGLVQRHLVVPFLFIFPVQTGHRGQFVVTAPVNRML